MSRIRSLDLARGFTVLMMAPVHTVLLYSHPAIYGTLLVKTLAFIAEGPGAQLFMCLMGIYVALSRPITWRQVCRRSGILMIGGYALNTLKFVLPFTLGLLPAGLLSDLQIRANGSAIIHLLLIGDIFHFAALAFLVVGCLRRYRCYPLLAVAIAFMVALVAPVGWDKHAGNIIVDYGWQLLGGQPPRTFFPVFPWLVYPLCGLTMGFFIRRNAGETFRIGRDSGVVLILFQYVYRMIFPARQPANFYRTQAPETLQHLGIVFLCLFAWHWISKYVQGARWCRLLEYSSRRITRLYVLQWLIIIGLVPVVGYQQQQSPATMVLIVLTTALTYGISSLIDTYNEFASVTDK